jgi:UDP-glucose 4-epimerase
VQVNEKLTLESMVLVTGGAGFIGSHLCELLVNAGYKNVFSLDNYSTGHIANHVPGVSYLTGSTTDIEKIVDFSPDLVFHLGEYSRVERSFLDLDTVWESNARGTFNVLRFCVNRSAKLVYAGSSTKFADDGLGPSQSPYGWTKASNTRLIESFSKWFSLSYAIVYFYNAYGGREIAAGDYATVIGIFSRQARDGESLKVVSPGTQERNFTHVNDIVNGLKLVGEAGEGDGYGIGHDKSWSVLQVAQLYGKEIEMLPARIGNRMGADLVVTKTKSLGWEAKIDLADYVASLSIGH